MRYFTFKITISKGQIGAAGAKNYVFRVEKAVFRREMSAAGENFEISGSKISKM